MKKLVTVTMVIAMYLLFGGIEDANCSDELVAHYCFSENADDSAKENHGIFDVENWTDDCVGNAVSAYMFE